MTFKRPWSESTVDSEGEDTENDELMVSSVEELVEALEDITADLVELQESLERLSSEITGSQEKLLLSLIASIQSSLTIMSGNINIDLQSQQTGKQ